MLDVSAKADIAKARRMLGEATRQLPFVTATALTQTVKLAQIAEKRALPSVFDKPTPFTERGIAIKPATKGTPTAAVYVRPQQAAAGLLLQETGGTRRPKKRGLVQPVGADLNQYGNLPRRGMKNLLKRKDVFVGTVKGIGGVWQRPARGKRRDGLAGTKGNTAATMKGQRTGLTLLIAFEDQAVYRPRFGFKPRAVKVIKASLGPAFREAVQRALRTAR
ncbi:hypothetical protein [Roseomonas xinghualingensis]|uniref:hypothetical protein n=1 Tax=Roseomonas xinghualingensis TaxID=2986475 RepID=UPI0021F0A924|nr:hypothetical protein [Roseomonas sp. SXEYE001]MCV4210395.1 hypothetical protein [Roseomonas sp. SXEYE001]